MWLAYLKSTAVPVDKIFQTEILKCDSRFVMWHVLRDLLLTETLSASWVFFPDWHLAPQTSAPQTLKCDETTIKQSDRAKSRLRNDSDRLPSFSSFQGFRGAMLYR